MANIDRIDSILQKEREYYHSRLSRIDDTETTMNWVNEKLEVLKVDIREEIEESLAKIKTDLKKIWG